jgi:hypothetical protein
MGDKSRFSNPNRPDSVFERAAAWPGKFMETQFNNMTGDRPMSDEKQGDFFTNAGKGIEGFAAGGIGGANSWIQAGADKLRSDDVLQKLLGGLQMIAGNIGKIVLPVLGMAPTAISNVSALASSTWNGMFGKKDDSGQVTKQSISTETPNVPVSDADLSVRFASLLEKTIGKNNPEAGNRIKTSLNQLGISTNDSNLYQNMADWAIQNHKEKVVNFFESVKELPQDPMKAIARLATVFEDLETKAQQSIPTPGNIPSKQPSTGKGIAAP